MFNRACVSIFGILVLSFTISVEAQEIGRGKLLKRLRNDIFGKKDADRKESSKRSDAKQDRTPTRAKLPPGYEQRLKAYQQQLQKAAALRKKNQGANERDRARTGNPYQRTSVPVGSSRRRPTDLGPTPDEVAAEARFQRERAEANRSVVDDESYRIPTPPRRPGTPLQGQQVSTRNSAPAAPPKGAAAGFGMTVRQNGDSVIVQKVEKGGNAEQAGLRPGDIIEELGGLEIQTATDIDEFASILGQGDQMEFKINSRGKSRTTMVSYGRIQEETSDSLELPRGDVSGAREGTGNSILETYPDDSREIIALKRIIIQQKEEIETLKYELERSRQQLYRLQPQRSRR